MSERTAPRPVQVTFGGGVILVGSVFVLFSVFDTIAKLRSIATRESVEKMLSEAPLKGTGLTLQNVLDVMHGASLVAGGCAAATAILGGYVLARRKSARLGVTVLAVPLLLAGMVSGGFASSMVAVSAILLWTRPARDWFDGRTPAQSERPAARSGESGGSQRPVWPPPYDPPAGDSAGDQGAGDRRPGNDAASPVTGDHARQTDGQPANHPDGQPGSEPRAYSGFGSASTTPAAAHRAGPTSHVVRPRELVAACVLTWAFSALVLAATVVGLVAFSADDALLREMHESDTRFAEAGVTIATLRVTALVSCALFAVWSLFAVVLAGLAFIGQNWARWTLLVSAIVAALLSLLVMVSAPVVLVLTGAAVYVAVLLTRPQVGRWLTRSTPR